MSCLLCDGFVKMGVLIYFVQILFPSCLSAVKHHGSVLQGDISLCPYMYMMTVLLEGELESRGWSRL